MKMRSKNESFALHEPTRFLNRISATILKSDRCANVVEYLIGSLIH